MSRCSFSQDSSDRTHTQTHAQYRPVVGSKLNSSSVAHQFATSKGPSKPRLSVGQDEWFRRLEVAARETVTEGGKNDIRDAHSRLPQHSHGFDRVPCGGVYVRTNETPWVGGMRILPHPSDGDPEWDSGRRVSFHPNPQPIPLYPHPHFLRSFQHHHHHPAIIVGRVQTVRRKRPAGRKPSPSSFFNRISTERTRDLRTFLTFLTFVKKVLGIAGLLACKWQRCG